MNKTISEFTVLKNIKSTDLLAIENNEASYASSLYEIIGKYLKDTVFKQFTGAIEFFSLNTPTKDWLLCNGESYYMEEYPNLAEYLGEDFIDPEDPSKFKVPNTQGYFIRTLDPSKTIDVDERTVGSIQDDSLQIHQHSLASDVSLVPKKNDGHFGGSQTQSKLNFSNVSKKTVSVDDARTASETRPKNIAYNAYIHI